jgi:hypothetical protein
LPYGRTTRRFSRSSSFHILRNRCASSVVFASCWTPFPRCTSFACCTRVLCNEVQCRVHRHRIIRISDPSAFETFSNRRKFARYSRGFRGKFAGFRGILAGFCEKFAGFREKFAGFRGKFAGYSRVFAGSAVREPRAASAPRPRRFAGYSRVAGREGAQHWCEPHRLN